MDHTCHRGTAAVFDVGCGTRDRARRRDTAEQGGNDITCALGHQLGAGAVLSADHAVRYRRRKAETQSPPGSAIVNASDREPWITSIAKHRQTERRKLLLTV